MLTESWAEGKSVEQKDAQPTERTTALWGLSSKINSRIWVNFTRNGLRLGSRHQEPPHTDMSRNLATVVVRGVLPGLRRRRTGLLPSGPKCSFQMRASFVFHLETKVLESGGRVEKLTAQVAWSPVLSFHSLWWFGGAMSSAGVGPLCFLKNNVTASVYQDILEHFMLPSADQLFKDADFIFQRDLAPAHTAKSTKSWLNYQLNWPANSLHLHFTFSRRFYPKRLTLAFRLYIFISICVPWESNPQPFALLTQCSTTEPHRNTRPEPHWEYMRYCQEENEKQETKKCRWAEGHCQRNLGFHNTSAVPQTDHLHAAPNWGSN